LKRFQASSPIFAFDFTSKILKVKKYGLNQTDKYENNGRTICPAIIWIKTPKPLT
jgi:hypothetical protein